MADRTRVRGTPPCEGKLQIEAYEAGKKARTEVESDPERDPRVDVRVDPPVYQRKSLTTSWKAGWDDAGPAPAPAVESVTQAPAPAVESARPVNPRAFWPADQALPDVYQRRQLVPCQRCRRVLTDELRQAVTLAATAKGIAHFHCRCCGEDFKLRVVDPVQMIERAEA